MSESRNKAADIAQRITDNYFARFDEEASNEDKVALFANAFHLIAAELNKCAGSAETGGEKAETGCPTCYPQGGFHHIDCPNQPGGAYNNRFTDWPLSSPESREPEKLNNAPLSPITISPEALKVVEQWAADDRLWATQETVEFNLVTFARAILKVALAESSLSQYTSPTENNGTSMNGLNNLARESSLSPNDTFPPKTITTPELAIVEDNTASSAAVPHPNQASAQEREDAARTAMQELNPPANWPEHYAEAMAIIDGRNTEPVDRRHLIAMRAERIDHAGARARRELKA